MLKSLFAICAVVGMLGLSGCSGMGRGETVGTAGGAAAGGLVGSAVTGGSTLGTLGGAAIGGDAGPPGGANYGQKHPKNVIRREGLFGGPRSAFFSFHNR